MRKVVSVSLDEGLDLLLIKNAKKQKLTKSEVIKRALTQYFYLNDAKQIRTGLKKYAENAGYLSEEDIYKDIS
ncbi:ribbon-helix-helix protein, CopG family [Leptospira interrogans]|uniref:ribbon-helix-helix protein, CopG family n=1 Tax=Leptospira interrogans TaxID=173 RepID=UPI000347FAB9|nr:ribbon-helix-helix protein, CopG family [Leptospira interrogans]